MKKILASLIAAVLGITTSYAQDAQPDQTPQKAPQGTVAKRTGKQPRNPEKRQQKMLERRAERLNQKAAEILATFDIDKDGKLSQGELDAMNQKVTEARKLIAQARLYTFIKALDSDENFTITPEEVKNNFDQARQCMKHKPGHRGGRTCQPARQK